MADSEAAKPNEPSDEAKPQEAVAEDAASLPTVIPTAQSTNEAAAVGDAGETNMVSTTQETFPADPQPVDAINGGSSQEKSTVESDSPVEPVAQSADDIPQSIPDSHEADDETQKSATETPAETASTEPPQDSPAADAGEEDIANSKGAKILLNRFSTWRQKTNENAQSLWKQAPTLQENAKNLWSKGPKMAQSVKEVTKVTLDGDNQKEGEEKPDTDMQQSDQTSDAPNKEDDDGNVNTNTGDNGDKRGAMMETAANLFATRLAAIKTVRTSSSNKGKNATSTAGGNGETKDSDGDATANADASTNIAEDTSATPENKDFEATRARVGVAVNRAAVAASVVAESVAGFRGRYTADKPDDMGSPSRKRREAEALASKIDERESQTALILKSRAAKHMQNILDALEDHEFAMLLGKGMLGVNLKQCYLKNTGVFVDYLVSNGQAEISGVVRSGDLLIRLGETDLRKGTIAEIPQLIAQSKRPIVLILATGTKAPLDKINYIDISVAMVHRARDLFKERFVLGNQDNYQAHSNTEEANQEGDQTNADPSSLLGMTSTPPLLKTPVPLEATIDAFVTPPIVAMEVKKELINEVAQRCNDGFLVSELIQIADLDNNLRATLNNAFLACAIDPRKLPFLTRHLSSSAVELEDEEGKMTASTQLMLFLELHLFSDLHGVTPTSRVRHMANKIAFKFFLPTKIGDDFQPPLFDFHHIVPDSSLRHLEFVLSGSSKVIPRDVFLDFQKSIVESLVGTPFLSFIVSVECARMRGYLRNTAPFVNLPLHLVAKCAGAQSKNANAKNTFAYILVYLLCRLEKESIGDNGLFAAEGSRLFGSSSGLTCVVFIQGVVKPAIEIARKEMNEAKTNAEHMECLDKLKQIFERLWEAFVSPKVGSLELLPKKNETGAAIKALRTLLASLPRAKVDATDPESAKALLVALLDKGLENAIAHLSEELLYDYAANTHIKFKEHKYHELMCSELCKRRMADSTYSRKNDLQAFPQGCIKRLLRKVELPIGVSAHKPSYISDASEADADTDSLPKVCNGEYAVVFGSATREQTSFLSPIPSMEQSNIRRFACIELEAGEPKLDSVDANIGNAIPITFENYAAVPPPKLRPFSDPSSDLTLSGDGWTVSLVNFIIPNGESSSGDATESALFGVSLVFHKVDESKESSKEKFEIVLKEADKKEADEDDKEEQKTADQQAETPAEAASENDQALPGAFNSPLSFKEVEEETANEVDALEDGDKKVDEAKPTKRIRQIKLDTDAPAFKKQAESISWSESIEDQANEDESDDCMIGLALACRQNTILAMRETLSRLLWDFSRRADADENNEKPKSIFCDTITDILGAFANQDTEQHALAYLLRPYTQVASSPWIERPFQAQKREFELRSVRHMHECLPPTPLALMFVTALLEQKIVLSSTRRSALHSVATALAAMLRPLKWRHLLVPLVPASLASDLIQYPAPFILGVCSEDADSLGLLGSLPNDVTLVDLDVGRVILAPAFGHDNEMVTRSVDAEATIKALRSQALYLAQSLGYVFGNRLSPECWGCDMPSPATKRDDEDPAGRYTYFMESARSFVEELMAGSESCSYWIQEASLGIPTTDGPTVLFDEDRFFHIKNTRSQRQNYSLFDQRRSTFAISIKDFDLILESLLRCQSVSTHVSSRPKESMIYY